VDHYKSDVWIGLDDPSMDWQGSLNLWCRECWHEQEEDKHKKWALPAWRKACKQQWLKRDNNNNEHFAKRVRSVAWETAKLDIEDQSPGESRKELRARLIRKSSRLAVTISASIQKLRLDQQEKVVKVMDHWVDEWEKKQRTPITCRPWIVWRQPPHISWNS
jgi:hypothetical protein